MVVRKRKAAAKPVSGMARLTDVNILPEGAFIQKLPGPGYKYRYTTGPFLLPKNSGSLDWVVLNNDASQQEIRVTVFKCDLLAAKSPMPPGPLVTTIAPGRSTHNANTYTEGFYYEVQVECNSQLVFPYVSIWPGNFGVAVPGTGIDSGTFVRTMS